MFYLFFYKARSLVKYRDTFLGDHLLHEYKYYFIGQYEVICIDRQDYI